MRLMTNAFKCAADLCTRLWSSKTALPQDVRQTLDQSQVSQQTNKVPRGDCEHSCNDRLIFLPVALKGSAAERVKFQ